MGSRVGGGGGKFPGRQETLSYLPRSAPRLPICRMRKWGLNRWAVEHHVLFGLRRPLSHPLSTYEAALLSSGQHALFAVTTEKAEEKRFSAPAGTSCFQLSWVMSHSVGGYSHAPSILPNTDLSGRQDCALHCIKGLGDSPFLAPPENH